MFVSLYLCVCVSVCLCVCVCPRALLLFVINPPHQHIYVSVPLSVFKLLLYLSSSTTTLPATCDEFVVVLVVVVVVVVVVVNAFFSFRFFCLLVWTGGGRSDAPPAAAAVEIKVEERCKVGPRCIPLAGVGGGCFLPASVVAVVLVGFFFDCINSPVLGCFPREAHN